jgi:hypothetical protein
MKRDPKSYEQAIKDLAELWIVERKMVLGDRRTNQYIITHDKRAFGFDYQFKGDKTRWKDSSESIQKLLLDVPELYELFHEEIGRKPKYEIKVEKASTVKPSINAVDLEQDFQNNPVMFGEMYKDDFAREEVKAIFKLQNVTAMNRFKLTEISFAYEFNQARDAL